MPSAYAPSHHILSPFFISLIVPPRFSPKEMDKIDEETRWEWDEESDIRTALCHLAEYQSLILIA